MRLDRDVDGLLSHAPVSLYSLGDDVHHISIRRQSILKKTAAMNATKLSLLLALILIWADSTTTAETCYEVELQSYYQITSYPECLSQKTFTLESGKLYKSLSLGPCADGDTLSIFGVEVTRMNSTTVNATGYNDIEGAICKQSHPNLTVGAASFTSVCKGYFSVPGSFGANVRVDKVVPCPED